MSTQKHDDSQNNQSVYIPIAEVIPGNNASNNPAAVNPVQAVTPPAPTK